MNGCTPDEELAARFTAAAGFVMRGVAGGTYCPSRAHCTRCRWAGCIVVGCKQDEAACKCAPFHRPATPLLTRMVRAAIPTPRKDTTMNDTPGRLRVGWFAVTNSVVISDSKTEDEVEIPRAEWIRFVGAVKAGTLDEPWVALPAACPGACDDTGAGGDA